MSFVRCPRYLSLLARTCRRRTCHTGQRHGLRFPCRLLEAVAAGQSALCEAEICDQGDALGLPSSSGAAAREVIGHLLGEVAGYGHSGYFSEHFYDLGFHFLYFRPFFGSPLSAGFPNFSAQVSGRLETERGEDGGGNTTQKVQVVPCSSVGGTRSQVVTGGCCSHELGDGLVFPVGNRPRDLKVSTLDSESVSAGGPFEGRSRGSSTSEVGLRVV